MPKVSVILPVYNPGRHHARECVRSILDQTFTDFEVIIVNDGTTDGSLDVMFKSTGGDSRFKFIGSSTNQGSIKARCVGLEQATGEYVLFFDSDDRLHPFALQTLTDKARETDADAVIMNFYYHLNRSGINMQATPPSHRGLVLPPGKTAEQLVGAFFGSKGITSGLWDKIVRRSCYPATMPDMPKVFLGEDTLMSLVFAPNVHRFASTDFCGYYYRVNGGSASWVTRRWDDYKVLHSHLCGMAGTFANDLFDADALILQRSNMTLYNLLRHAATRSLTSWPRKSYIRHILTNELTDPFWKPLREFINKISPDRFENPREASALLDDDIDNLTEMTIEHLHQYRNLIIFEKFARYV